MNNLETNLKRSINYNYFIRLITYYTVVLFIVIGLTNLLNNILVFAVVCGLLFNDPFNVISTISNLLSGLGDKGLAGFISLLIIYFAYRR